MKRNKNHRQNTEKPLDNLKKYIIYTGTLIIIIGLLFVFRGWLRVTVLPKTIGEFYANGVQSTFNKEIADLQNPYKLLAFTNPKSPSLGCGLSQPSDGDLGLDGVLGVDYFFIKSGFEAIDKNSPIVLGSTVTLSQPAENKHNPMMMISVPLINDIFF